MPPGRHASPSRQEGQLSGATAGGLAAEERCRPGGRSRRSRARGRGLEGKEPGPGGRGWASLSVRTGAVARKVRGRPPRGPRASVARAWALAPKAIRRSPRGHSSLPPRGHPVARKGMRPPPRGHGPSPAKGRPLAPDDLARCPRSPRLILRRGARCRRMTVPLRPEDAASPSRGLRHCPLKVGSLFCIHAMTPSMTSPLRSSLSCSSRSLRRASSTEPQLA